MNLTTGEWIPVVWEDGRADRVSLLDAFQRGDRIRDLAVRPHERVALMRLLICVAQAALDGPRNREEWLRCRDLLPEAAARYLAKWNHAFELFGEGQRFLQVANIEVATAGRGQDESNSPSKLDFALATGNNPTLFDNAGGGERVFSPAALALALLTFQNFSPGGLIGDVTWHSRSMGRTSTHAPCIVKAMIHAYVRGTCLLATICSNMLTLQQARVMGFSWGRPVWESMPSGPDDRPAVENATATLLGRLVPLSRAIWLDRDGKRMVLGSGLSYDPSWREVAATWVVRERAGKTERIPLSASLAKSFWREAHSIAVLARADQELIGGPLALTSGERTVDVDLWCGALAANKSKLLDAVESVLNIPTNLFADAGQRLYQQGVSQAENWARRINRAISTSRRSLRDELDKAQFRARGALVKQKAASHYWTAIEQKVPLLLALVADRSLLRSEGSDKNQWGATAWGKALAFAARQAYELACPRGTPRQLKAYALGLSVLFRLGAEEEAEDEPSNEEGDE